MNGTYFQGNRADRHRWKLCHHKAGTWRSSKDYYFTHKHDSLGSPSPCRECLHQVRFSWKSCRTEGRQLDRACREYLKYKLWSNHRKFHHCTIGKAFYLIWLYDCFCQACRLCLFTSLENLAFFVFLIKQYIIARLIQWTSSMSRNC